MGFLDFLKKTGGSRRRETMVARVVDYLDQHRLSTIPSILAKIMEVGQNPNASIADYARLYEMDQSACMRLLVLANSVYYGARTGAVIRNIEDAITRVGVRRAQEIINSSVVAGLFKSTAAVEDYSTPDLWLNSVAVAVGNRMLCAVLKMPPFETHIDPYLAGLLHDVGISIQHQCFFHDGFKEAVEARALSKGLLLDEEASRLVFTHADLGLELARHWKMPEELTAVLGCHHNLAVEKPESLWLVQLTRVSQWMAFELQLGYSDFGEAQAPGYTSSAQALGLDDRGYAKVKEQLAQEVARLKDVGWFSALKVRRI